jgi:hypothetical protein
MQEELNKGIESLKKKKKQESNRNPGNKVS